MQNNSDTDKNLNTLLDEIKQDLLVYVDKKLRLFKLTSYEKLSISASSIGYSLIVVALVMLMLFFVLIGLALFIGELLNSMAAGFGIMGLASLLVLFIVFLFRKSIKKSLLNKTIIFIRKVENDE